MLFNLIETGSLTGSLNLAMISREPAEKQNREHIRKMSIETMMMNTKLDSNLHFPKGYPSNIMP